MRDFSPALSAHPWPGVTAGLKTRHYASPAWDELSRLDSIAHPNIRVAAGHDGEESQLVTFTGWESLRDLPSSEKLLINEVTAIGILAGEYEPWQNVEEVARRAADVAATGRLELGCEFEERNSKQSPKRHDTVYAIESPRGVFFGYRAGEDPGSLPTVRCGPEAAA